MKTKRFIAILLPILIVLGILLYYIIPDVPASDSPDINTNIVSSSESSQEASDSADIFIVSSEEIPESTEPEPTPTPEPEFEEYDLHLMAVGDSLIHMGVVKSGLQDDGTYNYDFLFDNIADFLELADVKIINQETILGGNDLGFSGYPLFNSPTEVGDAIAKAGFNVVTHSTNHTGDKGIPGINNCVSFWSQYPEVLVTGICDDEGFGDEIPIIEVDNFKFAVLNYAYGPNASIISSDLRKHMKLLCAVDTKTGSIDFNTLNPAVLEDIQKAKEVADIVIVCPHWGVEYQTTPNKLQKQWALDMTEAGADVIIGTHPHVPQPLDRITGENGNTSLCYYSLGNYVSTQKIPLTMLEAMAWITFHVTEDGISISDDNTGIVPLVNHYVDSPTRVKKIYLLEEYTEELAAKHGIWTYGKVELHLNDLLKWSTEIFKDNVLTKEQIFQTAENEE